MYLETLDSGHRKPAALFLRTVGLMSRSPMADVLVALLYRPELGGGPLLDLAAATMRGSSFWSAAEREYLALVTARIHQCRYCVDIHTELVAIASRQSMDPEDEAALRPELRAVAQVIEACHADDGDVPAALRRARTVPVPFGAIHHALAVHLVWDVVNRLSHAYGFELRSGQLQIGTRALHLSGYRLPGFLTGSANGRVNDADTPFASQLDALRKAPLEAAGRTCVQLSTAAVAGEALPEPWRDYAEMLRHAPYRLGHDDVRGLKAAGISEDQIIEVTTAVALGAGLRTFDRVERAMTDLQATR